MIDRLPPPQPEHNPNSHLTPLGADPPLTRPVNNIAQPASGAAEFVRQPRSIPAKAVVESAIDHTPAQETPVPPTVEAAAETAPPEVQEPPHNQIGPDEPVAEGYVRGNGSAASEPQADLEPSTDDTTGPTVPPTDRPPENVTSPEQPDRGAELAKVINYAQNFREEARKALEATVRTLPDGDEVIESLAERGITLEDAAYSIPVNDDGTESSVGAQYYEKEQALARLQYGDAMEASGLKLGDDVEYEAHVLMTDPEPFADALRTVTPPDNPEQKAGFASHIGAIVDESLGIASLVTVVQHQEEAKAMCGDYEYRVFGYPGWGASEEQIAMGNKLPQQADAIAEQLPRLGVSDDTTRQVGMLASANREGLVIEWGVAQRLRILGRVDRRIGAAPAEIGYKEGWDAACKFLGHLQATAPNAQFTQEVRRSVLDDLDAAAGTPMAQAAQKARARVLRILRD